MFQKHSGACRLDVQCQEVIALDGDFSAPAKFLKRNNGAVTNKISR